MKEMAEWQENLLHVHIPQKQLVKQLAPIELVALLSRLAMNAGSDAFVYAMLRMTMATEQAERLKKSYEEMSPEVETAYQQLSEEYLAMMEAILQQVSARLLEKLE